MPELNKLKNQKFTWLLFAGHGGIIDGKYVTPGKRSPVWSDGSQLFEGVANREICAEIKKQALERGVFVDFLNEHVQEDWTLQERVRRANNYYNIDPTCINIFIHCNGHGNPDAHGWECFTSPGKTRADEPATILYEKVKKRFPGRRLRTSWADGDPDKEANFYVLKKTIAPSILSENFFMTNPEECKEILMRPCGISKVAAAHVDMILEMENRYTNHD